MTPELVELARRLVGCHRWRWMGGMFWFADTNCPACNGAGGFRWDETGGSENGEQCPCGGRLPHYPGFPVQHSMVGALPDLTDPATIGCLLALVRDAWGSDRCFVRRDPSDGPRHNSFWFALCPTPSALASRVGEGWSGPFVGDTEAGALVAALLAAP